MKNDDLLEYRTSIIFSDLDKAIIKELKKIKDEKNKIRLKKPKKDLHI